LRVIGFFFRSNTTHDNSLVATTGGRVLAALLLGAVLREVPLAIGAVASRYGVISLWCNSL